MKPARPAQNAAMRSAEPDDPRRRRRARLASAAVLLAVLALLALGAAPLGWRAGWWGLALSFELLAAAGLLGLAGGILAAVVLALAPRGLGWRRYLLLGGAVLLGAWFIVTPLELWLRHAPAIHDISTDVENPPAIVAALPALRAERAASAAYAGPALAAVQRSAYPDIAPLFLPLDRAKAFALALATARSMPRWRILASDPATGRIEASATSFWFGFTDDVVIRVEAAGQGSRVDMRSVSRQGRGDLGVNARRIRRYLAALRRAAG